MTDQAVGYLMEIGKVGEGGDPHRLTGQTGLCEVSRTFAAQCIDAGFFHFKME